MKIYISGPMTGYENFNRAAFNAKAKEFQDHGHVVLNPAILPDGLQQSQYMDICLAMLRAADSIYYLPGIESSDGARCEMHYARKLNLVVLSGES